mgnify:CR=1 FL=1
MKLAVITPRYAPGGVVGGAETLLRTYARGLAVRGHEVHLLTTCATDHTTWANATPAGTQHLEGMSVHSFPVDEGRDLPLFFQLQGRIDRRQPLSPREEALWVRHNVNSRALTDWLAAEAGGLDAIVAGPYLFGLILAACAVCPQKTWLVPCLHDEPFARLGVVADMFRSVRGLLFNAEPERTLAVRLYGLPSDCGAVVGMGIEPFEADPAPFVARHRLPQPYLLYAGRREAGKNTPLLLDYVATYRSRRQSDLPLVLVGSGSVDIPDRLRSGVIDLGFVSEADKRAAMAGAAVFLHPSTNESFGIVLLEAWMAGTPALVHRKSAVLQWQCEQADAGLWFGYYPEFEAMLDLLLQDRALAGRLGQNGRRHVRTHYHPGAILDRLQTALSS